MKILYIAHERGGARLAARALHGIAPNVTLAWAQTLGSALRWLQENRDAAAVIVEVQAQSCAPFVEELRGLGLTTPVVVVVGSGQLEPAVGALNAGADGYVVAGPSLETDLPRIVAAAAGPERRRGERLTQTRIELESARDAAEQRLADVQARHTASLAREARICTALQQRLFELENALRHADERWAAEAVAFADQLAKRHAEFTASLTHTAQSRDAVAAQLSIATAALEEAQQGRRADAAAAVEHLWRREAELGAALAEAVAARTTLEAVLAEADAAHRDARQRAEGDLAAANERQAALEDLLTQEADRRTTLDQKLAAAEAARQEADRLHTTELTKAAAWLADLQARHDAALAEHAAARAALERQLTEAVAAHRQADDRAAAALTDASTREADLVERLTSESDRRAALERDLAAVRLESACGRRRLLHVASAYRRRAREQKASLEAQLAGERADADRERRATHEEIRQIQIERDTLRQLLGTTQDQLQHLHRTVDEDRQAHERARLTSESQLRQMSADSDQLRQSFEHLQSAFQILEQIAGEHAAERARLETVVADRDRQLSAQAERHQAADQAAQEALARMQDTLRQTIEAGAAEIARFQRELGALRRELDAARSDAETLRGDAERVPALAAQLELTERERRGAFERAPYGLVRCTPDGVIIDANHSFIALLGRRRVDELRNMAFAAAVLDRAGDLDWMFERMRTVRKTEPVETVWKTADGRDRTVRLQALVTSAGSVEIVVEDITDVRVLEERLRQSSRMEAVGRLASEVAATCDALLRDAIRGAHDWIAAGDDGLRREGERMVAELTRAASFLRQLAAYGDEQRRALKPVSVRRVLHDLTPVLQRVVGDQIELVLSKSSGAFEVDVEPGRLERILVNVAGYARERMPDGGTIGIDLATWEVGRRFVAQHPDVRPGAHVLITVAGRPGTGDVRVDTAPGSPSSDKPGVDLGALIDLVGTCGGHLWMEAQPAGNMVVKIHLPKPAAPGGTDTRRSDARSDRGGRLTRWFRSTSAGGVRA